MVRGKEAVDELARDGRGQTDEPPGSVVGAANRDPQRFSNPDQLDITREDNRHLSFGFGSHFCLGAALARLEGQITINAVVQRWPDLRLATEELEWRYNPSFRSLISLPVAF